jgi:hypothetical protein
MRSECDYEHWQATRLLDKCWRDRVMVDQPPVSAVAFGAFKLMNAAHDQMRDEIARLREENAMLRREIEVRRCR